MGEIRTAGNTFLRDYVTDQVPATGPNKPAKAQGRSLFGLIEDRLDIVQEAASGAFIIKDTKAALDGDLDHAAGVYGRVIADGTDANNGYYKKSGASGSGSWAFVGAEPAAAARDEAEGFRDEAEGFKDDAEAAATSVQDAVSQVAATVELLAGPPVGAPLVDISLLGANADTIAYIVNRAASEAVDDDNLIAGMLFGGPRWVMTGETINQDQADESGGITATRLRLASTGDMYVGLAQPAGTYTITFRAKSLTGGSQTVKVGNLLELGSLASKTVTTSWSEIRTTVVAGTTFYPYIAADGSNALDIAVQPVRIAVGSDSDTSPAPDGHVYFGDVSGGRPAKIGQKMFANGSPLNAASLTLAEPLDTTSSYTIIACVEQTADESGYAGIIGSVNYPDLHLTLESGRLTAYRENTQLAARHDLNLYGLGPVMVGVRFDADRNEQSLLIGDVDFQYDTVTGAGTDIQRLVLGSLVGTGSFRFPGNIGDIEVHASALSPTELQRAFDRMRTKMRLGPKEIWNPEMVWIAEGDSRSGLLGAFPDKITSSLAAENILTVKAAYQGDGIKQLYERAARLDAMVREGRRTYITLLIGANDFDGYGFDEDLYWDDIKRWLDRRYQAGHDRIDVCTSLPADPAQFPGFNTNRPNLDALIRAGEGRYFNRVIDLAASSMGSDAAGADTAKYYDGTHTTSAGSATLGGIVEPYVLAAKRGRSSPMSAAGAVSSQHPPREY